ncbi:MAG: hypothetical protein KAU49_00750 [Candidatus Krumholzibacteria bacterium]|nr:hypothetical protein [Candidatus Krumholzibacteria bacterium]
MKDGLLTVQRLQCGHCGGELPVMGKYVTFQCGTCFRRCVITDDGLKPLNVYRASPPEEREGRIVYLPFWVITADVEALRKNVAGVMTGLTRVSQKIATTKIERDTTEPDWVTELGMNMMGVSSADAHQPATIDSSHLTDRLPSRAELEHILGRMESAGRWHIYVPAFWTTNTRAYLKIGQLMTRKQPAFHAERFDDPEKQIMCALGPQDATRLVDYIFFATLPESIQTCSSFMNGIHLEVGSPVLIEFPFLETPGSLESLVGGFHIQPQMVGTKPSA